MATHKDHGGDYLRSATYSEKAVKCPNVNHHNLRRVAEPGDLVIWRWSEDRPRHSFGRVLGRVDAPALPGDVDAVKGWLAVLELSEDLHALFIRWVDPKLVSCVTSIPRAILDWVMQPQLPELPEILRLYRYGSLSEHYIANASPVPETMAEAIARDADARKKRNGSG